MGAREKMDVFSPEEGFGRSRCADTAAQCVGLSFRRASRLVTQVFDNELSPSGLRSTQLIVLVTIGSSVSSSLTGLARTLGLETSALHRTLKKLEAEGLIVKKKDGGARLSVALSEKGERTVADALPLWRNAQDVFVTALGADAWRDLQRNLEIAADIAAAQLSGPRKSVR